MRNSGKSCRDSDLTHLRLSTLLSRASEQSERDSGPINYRRPWLGTMSLKGAQNRRLGSWVPSRASLGGNDDRVAVWSDRSRLPVDALFKLQRSLDQVIKFKRLRVEECDGPIVRVSSQPVGLAQMMFEPGPLLLLQLRWLLVRGPMQKRLIGGIQPHVPLTDFGFAAIQHFRGNAVGLAHARVELRALLRACRKCGDVEGGSQNER